MRKWLAALDAIVEVVASIREAKAHEYAVMYPAFYPERFAVSIGYTRRTERR